MSAGVMACMSPSVHASCVHVELLAFSLLVLTDTFITNLVTAGEIFRRNKIVGRPARTIRAKVPSIAAWLSSIFWCHKPNLLITKECKRDYFWENRFNRFSLHFIRSHWQCQSLNINKECRNLFHNRKAEFTEINSPQRLRASAVIYQIPITRRFYF